MANRRMIAVARMLAALQTVGIYGCSDSRDNAAKTSENSASLMLDEKRLDQLNASIIFDFEANALSYGCTRVNINDIVFEWPITLQNSSLDIDKNALSKVNSIDDLEELCQKHPNERCIICSGTSVKFAKIAVLARTCQRKGRQFTFFVDRDFDSDTIGIGFAPKLTQ